MKVYHNSHYRRKLLLRRTALITGGIAVVAALAVVITLVIHPLTPIPTTSPDAVSSMGSTDPLPPSESSGAADSSSVSSAEPEPVSSETASSAESSAGDGAGWTPPAPPEDGPSYTKLYPDLYCPPAEGTYDEENVIFLTFDDGPSPNTDRILDVLKEKGVKATFLSPPRTPARKT